MSAEIIDLFVRPDTTEGLVAAHRELRLRTIEIATGVIDASFRNARTVLNEDYQRGVIYLTARLLEHEARTAYRELDGVEPTRMVRRRAHKKPRH
jgi:hypothetical protein